MWTEERLGDIADRNGGDIKTGPFGSQLHQSDYSDTGVPVVMPKNIVLGRVDDSDIARVSEAHVERLAHHKLKEGDIVYGRRGDIGRCALVTKREAGWLCGTGCLKLNVGETEVDPQFLFYFLNHPATIEWIFNQAVGATMPNLNTSILRSVPIRYPFLPIQRRIAEILSAYDDLIEVNTRRIAILEEMARRTYEEWFGRYAVPRVEGDNGGSWLLQDIADDVRSGVDPATVDPALPYLGLEHFPRRSLTFQNWGSPQDSVSTKLWFDAGDTLFGKIRPYFHKVLYSTTRGITSSDTVVFRPSETRFRALVALMASSDAFVEHATQTSNGTKMPRANVNVLKKFAVPRVSDEQLEDFNRATQPTLELAANLSAQNTNLRAQRDLLLPRLVSGEIDLSEAAAPKKVAAE